MPAIETSNGIADAAPGAAPEHVPGGGPGHAAVGAFATSRGEPSITAPAGRKGKRLIPIAIIALLVAAAAAFWLRYVQTYHLETVHAGVLYRDGNRGPREFATAVRKVRPRTVVSLIDDKELAHPDKPQFAAEAAFLGGQGVALERIPIVLGGWPTDADLQRFFAIVEDTAKQPVLFHCAQGVRRTGMLAAAYQMSALGWDRDRAKAELLTFGHSQRTVKDVQRFIDHYDPTTRSMTVKLEQSVE